MKLNNLRFLAISALITPNVYSSQIEEVADQSQVSSTHEQNMPLVAINDSSTQTVIPSEQDKLNLCQVCEDMKTLLTAHNSPSIKAPEAIDILKDYMENNFILPVDEIKMEIDKIIYSKSEKAFKKAYELNLSFYDAKKIISEYIQEPLSNLINRHDITALETRAETPK